MSDSYPLVGVKFCGNCNPQLDTMNLFNQLQKVTGLAFRSWSDEGVEVLLILSGCPTDCATRPVFTDPMLRVAGSSLDGISIPTEQLTEIILKRLEGINSVPRRK